nr:MAG TPA: hypothetical protein [Caudoviricetes sp.]
MIAYIRRRRGDYFSPSLFLSVHWDLQYLHSAIQPNKSNSPSNT